MESVPSGTNRPNQGKEGIQMQKFRFSMVALAVAATLAMSPVAVANDAALDAGTVFMVSTGDVAELKSAMAASDFGAFAKDPQIQQIMTRMKSALTDLAASTSGEPGSPEHQASGAIQAYLNALCNDATGYFSFSIGVRNSESGPQLQALLHCQGPDSIGAAQKQLVAAAARMSSEGMMRSTFAVEGAQFDGFDMPAMESPVGSPDGMYFGQKGRNFYFGMSKAGLTEYLQAAAGGEAKGRLGNSAFFKSAQQKMGKGHVRTLLNLRPVMDLVKMFVPEEDETMRVMKALGVFNIDGYYAIQNLKPTGTEGAAVFGLSSKDGIWELFPETNKPNLMPGYVGKHAMQAVVGRMAINKTLDIVYKVAGAAMGEEARPEIDRGLADFQAETGIDPKALVAAFEGSMFFSNAAAAPDPSAMIPIATGAMVGGVKIADIPTIQRALDTLAKHPEMQGMMRSTTHLNRKLLVIGGGGDEDPYGGSTPEYALTLDKDWLLMGTLAEVKRALATLDGGPLLQLSADPRLIASSAAVGSNGMMLSYSDNGAIICNGLDTVRPLLGFLPFLIGDNPHLMKLCDPSNLPSNEVVKKYFGVSVGVVRSSSEGMWMEAFSPTVSAGSLLKGAKDLVPGAGGGKVEKEEL